MNEPDKLRRAVVHQLGISAGLLVEQPGGEWTFTYHEGYDGPPISLTIPVRTETYEFPALPPAIEGLLPEGLQLESLLKTHKIDRNDTFRQLVTVGADLVGSLTIREMEPQEERN